MAAANLSGNYEYEAPGSKGSRTVKKMTLNGSGTVHYREEGETSLETFVISGQGTWRIVDDHVEFRFPALNKKNTLKRKVLVPGLEVPHTTFDDGFDVDVDKLLNAPVKGLHKWKRMGEEGYVAPEGPAVSPPSSSGAGVSRGGTSSSGTTVKGQTVFCSNCGTQGLSGRFCGNCGTPLK